MGALVLIVGGQKSGKSSYAAVRAAASADTAAVVTPAVVRDSEFAARVARHRAARPSGWHTVERFDLSVALRDIDHTLGDATPVIVDALDTWLAETLLRLGVDVGDDGPEPALRDRVEAVLGTRIDGLLDACRDRSGPVFVVAGQPGLGPHPVGAGARAYVDLHGLCAQRLSEAADEAVLMVAGRPLRLGTSGSLETPEPFRPPVTFDSAAPSDLLRLHGDSMVPDGCVDLAVNVEPGPPEWLQGELASRVGDLSGYPDDTRARSAAAARHRRSVDECLVVAGAAEAFWLLAQVLDARDAVCVSPSFTEPEAAIRRHGVPVRHVWRDPASGWGFDVSAVGDADFVVLGRPNNPTGTVDALDVVERLCRPGRIVVVDEAFAEFLDDADGVAHRSDLPGLVSVRSLTKLWGIAGLRVGYLLGPVGLVDTLASARQSWSISTLALHALERLVTTGEDERRVIAADVRRRRRRFVARLAALPGVEVTDGHANFVLVHTPGRPVHPALLACGVAVRPAHTFPGLDETWMRVTVRDDATNDRFAGTLAAVLEDPP